MRSCVVSQFPVTLSRSRVVNYSRPKGIENATSLLRCVRNPTNPFSILHPPPLALSVSRFEHPEKKSGGYGPEVERRRRGEEEATSWTCWLEFRWNRFLFVAEQSFHGLPNIAISSTRISPTPCKHRLLGNTGDAPYSIKFEFQGIFSVIATVSSYCDGRKRSDASWYSIYFVAIFLKLVRTNTFNTS